MYARRLVLRIESPFDNQLRQRIQSVAENRDQWAELEKDCLLVEAALATNRIVISLDETARNLFRHAAMKVGQLREVLWANPADEKEEVEMWISNNCAGGQNRRLGQS